MECCPRCRSTNLFAMDLTVAGGPARFVHCRACEHRFWTQEGSTRTLALSEVLAI